MSTTAIPMRSRSTLADRKGFLAAASALVAVASVGVTIAVTSGDDSPSGPAPAQPEAAAAYSDSAAVHAHPLESPYGDPTPAQRYHHFR